MPWHWRHQATKHFVPCPEKPQKSQWLQTHNTHTSGDEMFWWADQNFHHLHIALHPGPCYSEEVIALLLHKTLSHMHTGKGNLWECCLLITVEHIKPQPPPDWSLPCMTWVWHGPGPGHGGFTASWPTDLKWSSWVTTLCPLSPSRAVYSALCFTLYCL